MEGGKGANLLAQHDVGSHNSDLDNSQDPHETDNTQEAENIVVAALVLPEAAEHEEKFDEHNGEGDKPSN